jgi:UDP-N-acetylglucosamine:LPS N-acetylglucosamine transferase
MSARPVIIMAGGTGGHVFPALALARLLRARSFEVIWLGTRRGLEARVIPASWWASAASSPAPGASLRGSHAGRC